MTPQTEQLLQQVENDLAANKNELDATAQRWETAARAGCASVDELENQLDKLKTISKRLALRKQALTEQLAADAAAQRLASIEQLQAEIAASVAGVVKQFKAISATRDKFSEQLAAALEDGQSIKRQLERLSSLGCEDVPAAVMQISADTQTDANEFLRNHAHALTMPNSIFDYALQRAGAAVRLNKGK